MIAICVPAHDEEAHIGACLDSLRRAAGHPALKGEEVAIVVAADSCCDRTEAIASARGASVVALAARSVGSARAAAASSALAKGARWLCFTDADSVVAPDWLASHVGLGCDAVCGTVEIPDWGAYGSSLLGYWSSSYRDEDGHRHIHGANMSVSAAAYRACGGFLPLPTSEDVALVRALERCGARVAWSAAPRVQTSARASFKAPLGFGAELAAQASRLGFSPAAALAGDAVRA